jgi:ribosomal protein S18 acetylase RimI-like enzyme
MLLSLVTSYYSEDQKIDFNPSHLEATISTFRANPTRGKVEIFERRGDVVGYATLSTFWSNEYGGTIVYIDEIFVTPSARNAGIGRTYIRDLLANPPYSAVAIQLEITPDNERARSLYESLGFSEYPNIGFICEVPLVA